MKTEKIPTTLPEKWFLERVGKYIMAKSSTFNGMMKINDDGHAKYLCHVAQPTFHYRFEEMENQPFE